MSDCIFCQIAQGDVPCDKIFEDDHVLAFNDINPQAPVHILLIPKEHVVSLGHMTAAHVELAGRLQIAASQIARHLGVAGRGFRLVTNSGLDSGQSVFHLHYHLLAGRSFQWPPG